jgi:hypothetical protein
MTARQLRIRTAARFITLNTLVSAFYILPFMAALLVVRLVGW